MTRQRPHARRTAAPLASLVFAGALLASGPARGAPSSYSKSPSGTRVLFLFLEDLGYRPQRIFNATELDPRIDLLFLVGPTSGEMGRSVLAWAGRGKSLVFAPPFSTEEGVCRGFKLGPVTLERRLSPSSFLNLPFPTGSRPKGRAKGQTPRKPAEEHPTVPTADTDLRVRTAACLLVPPPTSRVLAGDPSGAVAFEHEAGEGRMLTLAYDALLVNALLDRDDLAVLLRRWIEKNVPRGARVAFFEERPGGGLVKRLLEANLVVFALHGLVFLLLLTLGLAPRFGDPPREPPPSTRREFSQHARALGHLYQHRGASLFVLKRQFERFLARVSGGVEGKGIRARLRPGDDAGKPARAQLATLVATRTGRDPDSIEALLAQFHHALAPRRAEDPQNVQRHFRLSQSLAALQRFARERNRGDTRGRKKVL